MNVKQMIEDIAKLVPPGSPTGTRRRTEARVATALGPLNVAVALRVDAGGEVRPQYWCEGVRLQRHELLRLTCPETDCPQSIAVRQQWQAFHRRRMPPTCAVRGPTKGVAATPDLMREEVVHVAGHTCSARPAIFRCFTRCPNAAHAPMWMEKSGFDVFEDGVCIAGGLAPAAVGSDGLVTTRPRIPTLAAAHAYILARSLEASAVMIPFVSPA